MGDCKYCRENAGFLRSAHRECEDKYNAGWSQMVSLSAHAAIAELGRDTLVNQLETIAQDSYQPATSVREALVKGWSDAVEEALDDHVLSQEEHEQLTGYMDRFSLSQDELNTDGAYTRLIQGAAIRDLLEGKIPARQNIKGRMPFNMMKSEKLVWLFNNVSYLEEQVRRERVGGSRGVSIRVMKGVYYNTGGFKSRTVERVETNRVDVGLLGVTTKHLYFSGSSKRFRVRYDRIVTFEPYTDGIGIMRDAASARPQTFITGDGWFIYNLVVNLADM